MKMMECGRYLNQRLQKRLFRFFQGQPDDLPMLVREKELASAVAGKSLRERSATPVKRHAFSICDLSLRRSWLCAADLTAVSAQWLWSAGLQSDWMLRRRLVGRLVEHYPALWQAGHPTAAQLLPV
jgi:hypothetical protein